MVIHLLNDWLEVRLKNLNLFYQFCLYYQIHKIRDILLIFLVLHKFYKSPLLPWSTIYNFLKSKVINLNLLYN